MRAYTYLLGCHRYLLHTYRCWGNNLVTGRSRSLGYCPNIYMYARGNDDNQVSMCNYNVIQRNNYCYDKWRWSTRRGRDDTKLPAGYRRSYIVWPLSSANPRRLPCRYRSTALEQLSAVTDALTRKARIIQPIGLPGCKCKRLEGASTRHTVPYSTVTFFVVIFGNLKLEVNGKSVGECLHQGAHACTYADRRTNNPKT